MIDMTRPLDAVAITVAGCRVTTAIDQASVQDYTWRFSPTVRDYEHSLLVQLFAALNINFDGNIAAHDVSPPPTPKFPTERVDFISLKDVACFYDIKRHLRGTRSSSI